MIGANPKPRHPQPQGLCAIRSGSCGRRLHQGPYRQTICGAGIWVEPIIGDKDPIRSLCQSLAASLPIVLCKVAGSIHVLAHFVKVAGCVQLWPGAVSWPDFLSQRTTNWWTTQLQGFYNQTTLDGVWLDMNEPSNFCTGDVCTQYGRGCKACAPGLKYFQSLLTTDNYSQAD